MHCTRHRRYPESRLRGRQVQKGHDLDAKAISLGDDLGHFSLGQIAFVTAAVLRLVTGFDLGHDGLMTVSRAVRGEGHVIQQEAETVIAERKLKLVIASGLHFVQQRDDPILGEILSAAVEMKDFAKVAGRSLHLDGLGSFEELLGVQFACQVPPVGQSRNGQNADHQDKHEQQGKNSGQILFHGMLSLLTLM